MATLSHAAFRMLIEKFGGCDEYFNEMINGIKPFEERINSLFTKDGEYMSAKFKHDVGSDDLLINDKISLKEFIINLAVN